MEHMDGKLFLKNLLKTYPRVSLSKKRTKNKQGDQTIRSPKKVPKRKRHNSNLKKKKLK